MAKKSLFGRAAQLAKANINAALDQAEDPQKMLDQTIREYQAKAGEAQAAVAQTIGNLRMIQEDAQAKTQAAAGWGGKAAAAHRKAEQLRSAGNVSEAVKFDNLTRVAIERQVAAEEEARSARAGIEAQEAVVERLKTGLNQMNGKLAELTGKRDELVARSRSAQAQTTMHDAIQSIGTMDTSTDIGRFEARIRREEAMVLGANELAASSLDAQFDALEDLGEQSEVEARLAMLRAGSSRELES